MKMPLIIPRFGQRLYDFTNLGLGICFTPICIFTTSCYCYKKYSWFLVITSHLFTIEVELFIYIKGEVSITRELYEVISSKTIQMYLLLDIRYSL